MKTKQTKNIEKTKKNPEVLGMGRVKQKSPIFSIFILFSLYFCPGNVFFSTELHVASGFLFRLVFFNPFGPKALLFRGHMCFGTCAVPQEQGEKRQYAQVELVVGEGYVAGGVQVGR